MSPSCCTRPMKLPIIYEKREAVLVKRISFLMGGKIITTF